MSAAERAVRDAVPKLEAIADRLGAVTDYGPPYEDCDCATCAGVRDLRSVVADLLSALDGSEDASGPTTAQEGQEGRSGRISGVSGDLTPCRPCGQPVYVERLDSGKTHTTDPDGTPHTCHPGDIHENRRTPYRPQETA